MEPMNDLEKAAMQALEAWQTSSYGQPSHQKLMVLAMTALRQALEQPAQQEPHGWYIADYGAVVGSLEPTHRKGEWKPFYTRPQAREPLTDVVKAARGVLEWTEIAHRPPVRDKLEVGRMVMVRLHALADLYDALATHGITGEKK